MFLNGLYIFSFKYMDSDLSRLPDWSPPGSALRILPGLNQLVNTTSIPKSGSIQKSSDSGIEGNPEGVTKPFEYKSHPKRRTPALTEYIEGVKKGNRALLAQAITLIESKNNLHQQLAQKLLTALLPDSGRSIRIGITGVPGAGKSSLIESIGTTLCQKGHKVAVLAVDPTSTLTHGSILGDKTRMENLSREPNAFIRPSPSGGTLGGVAARSRETMLLCEAAGYDVILVETVGVGQSEVTVRTLVDLFMLVLIPGGGDELQGIKKGVVELADLVVINKADGDNEFKASLARSEYEKALHYQNPITEGWVPRALACSAYTGSGLPELWQTVLDFFKVTQESGVLAKRRHSQKISWMKNLCEDGLVRLFYTHPEVQAELPKLENLVSEGKVLPADGMNILIELFLGKISPKATE